jgi:hypothetical protein
MNQRMKYNVMGLLMTYMPSFLELLGDQEISWTSINRILEAHIQKVRDEFAVTQEVVQKEATFYGVLMNHHFGTGESSGMFDFYDATFKSLCRILSNEEKKPIHRMLSKVLLNPNKDYLNFIGELATLNKLMLTEEYELINIEETIHPERAVSADIFFKRKKDGIELLIEVLNLHIENKEFKNNCEIESHLSAKFSKKVGEKIINPERLVLIQPVLWTSGLAQIKQLCDFYEEGKFNITYVIPPMTYATWRHLDGTFEYRFESVRTILKD